MAIISDSVEEANFHLKNNVVGIPTETVYGLAGNAFDANLVARIFQVKNRPTFDPLIVHTYAIDSIESFAGPIPEPLLKLANHFWPGPLTLLLPKKSVIPDIVTSGLPNVAVRIPNHPLTLELLKLTGFPLAAPSANPFGYISPTNAQHVNNQLGNSIPFILDGGPCDVGLESTIVGIEDHKIIIYRLGGISVEDIETIVGPVSFRQHTSNPLAPGMLDSHYSPRKKMLLGDSARLLELNHDLQPVLLRFNSKLIEYPDNLQLVLSPNSSVTEAAINLFSALRSADELAISLIIAEPVPDNGLGRAINDRLKRAAF
jgi:L-threonylcarbamoyladenylate synthase